MSAVVRPHRTQVAHLVLLKGEKVIVSIAGGGRTMNNAEGFGIDLTRSAGLTSDMRGSRESKVYDVRRVSIALDGSAGLATSQHDWDTQSGGRLTMVSMD